MEIVTPINKHKVELKDWITGKEGDDIERPMTNFKLSASQHSEVSVSLDMATAKDDMKKKSIEIVVLSVDGDKKDIQKKVENMHRNDYLFVLKKIDEVVSGKDFTKP